MYPLECSQRLVISAERFRQLVVSLQEISARPQPGGNKLVDAAGQLLWYSLVEHRQGQPTLPGDGALYREQVSSQKS